MSDIRNVLLCIVLYMYIYVCRLAREKKVPSASSRENYRSIMRKAEDEIFHLGYDIGKT